VTTSWAPKTEVPYRMIDVIVSGTSIIVLRTAHLLVVRAPARAGRARLLR
jgi:hypothetical protein